MMPPETADVIGQALGAALAALAGWALLELKKYLAAKTKTTLDERAVDVASQLLQDLTLQLAPELAKDLADGKLDAAERAQLLASAKRFLGEAGLKRLGGALGLDLAGVEDWLAMKLGAKATVVARPEKLGAFMASPELSKKILGGK